VDPFTSGRQGGDIDQAGHFRIGARLGDHRPARGVADEDDACILAVRALRVAATSSAREFRGLWTADPLAVGGELVIDAPPAGAFG